MITVFPGNSSDALVRSILQERWKIKGIKGYVDRELKLFTDYGVRGVPFSVLFDKDGKEIARFEGFPGRAAIEEKFALVLAEK